MLNSVPVSVDFSTSLRRYPAVQSRQAVLIGTAARLVGAISWAQGITTTVAEDRGVNWGSWDIANCLVYLDPAILLRIDRAMRGERPAYKRVAASDREERWAYDARTAVKVLLHELVHSFASTDRHRNLAEHFQMNSLPALDRLHEGVTDLITLQYANRYIRALGLHRTVPGILEAEDCGGYPSETGFLPRSFSPPSHGTLGRPCPHWLTSARGTAPEGEPCSA
jgi:hypothetical protein